MTLTTRPERPPLRDRLRAGEQVLGVLLRMPNETVIETCAFAGISVIVIDCEHGPADDLALLAHLRAADAADVDVLVRVGDVRGAEILRALDSGAIGIVAPHIDDLDAASRLVAATRHPPQGQRGFATYTRAGKHGSVDPSTHAATADERTIAIAMIESHTALQVVTRIAEVDGVDVLLPGPADLRHDLLASGAADEANIDEAVGEAIRRTATAAVSAGKATAAVCGNLLQVREALSAGVNLVLLNYQSFLLTGLREYSSLL